MTDLVQRLQSERSPLCQEAAREIERRAAMLREAKAEIIRLRDAKRRAMQIADERAKEVVDLRTRLAKSYAVDVSMISRLRKFTDLTVQRARGERVDKQARAVSATSVKKDRALAKAPVYCPVVIVRVDDSRL